jgi:hypothetical protein
VVDCSVYFNGVAAVPWHPYTRESQAMLTPGQPTEMKVEIFPTSLVVQPGHRLRVSITTGDLPHQGPNTWVLGKSTGGVSTIHFGGATPSAVYMGAVGQQVAAQPPVPGGLTLGGAAGGAAAAPANGQAGGSIDAVRLSAAQPLPAAALGGVALLVALILAAGVGLRVRRRG